MNCDSIMKIKYRVYNAINDIQNMCDNREFDNDKFKDNIKYIVNELNLLLEEVIK